MPGDEHPPTVEFHYELSGSGWSDCRVAVRGTECKVSASYLSDALGDLARAVESCLRGVDESRATFTEEPGEWRWCLSKVGNDKIRIRIVELPDWDLAEETGEVVFEAECSPRALGRAVARELARLLQLHGMAGYRKQWGMHDFPLERLQALERLLAGPGA